DAALVVVVAVLLFQFVGDSREIALRRRRRNSRPQPRHQQYGMRGARKTFGVPLQRHPDVDTRPRVARAEAATVIGGTQDLDDAEIRVGRYDPDDRTRPVVDPDRLP